MKFLIDLINKIKAATEPVNPETHWGDESTVKATEAVRNAGKMDEVKP